MLKFYFDFSFSGAFKSAMIIFIVLLAFFIIEGIKFSKKDPDKDAVPTKGFSYLAVILVDFIDNFVSKNLGEKNRKFYSPFMIGIVTTVGFANVAACFGITAPFSNLAVALTLSLLAYLIFTFSWIYHQGFKGKIDGMLGPVKGISFLVFPISLIGDFTTPFSMGMRMFGNIFSGTVIAGIVLAVCEALPAVLGSVIGTIGFAAVIHPIFDIFFGILQVYVYMMLIAMFIKQNQ